MPPCAKLTSKAFTAGTSLDKGGTGTCTRSDFFFAPSSFPGSAPTSFGAHSFRQRGGRTYMAPRSILANNLQPTFTVPSFGRSRTYRFHAFAQRLLPRSRLLTGVVFHAAVFSPSQQIISFSGSSFGEFPSTLAGAQSGHECPQSEPLSWPHRQYLRPPNKASFCASTHAWSQCRVGTSLPKVSLFLLSFLQLFQIVFPFQHASTGLSACFLHSPK